MRSFVLAAGLAIFAQAAQADWTPAQRLTWTSSASQSPSIAVDSSANPYLVWYDAPSGNYEIYFKKSTDGGSTWTASQRLTWTMGSSRYPAVAVDASGHLHVVWSDDTAGEYEVYHKKSADGGATWTTGQRLTWTPADSVLPAMAVDGSGHLHLVWHDSTAMESDIYYKKSTNGGVSWTASQRLTWNPGGSYGPDIAVDSSGYLHVAWEDDTAGDYEIYHKKSTDGGSNWTASHRLTWTSGTSLSAAIASGTSSSLHLAWADLTPWNFEIYYKKSPDGGATWTTSQRLTWMSGVSQMPAISVASPGNPLLIWADDFPGNFEIYYKNSTNGGTTWSTSQRLTWTLGLSLVPVIAVDTSGFLHLVWHDNTPGNLEIYYKKGK